MVNDLKQEISRMLLPVIAAWHPGWQDLLLAIAEAVDEPTPCAAMRSTSVKASTIISRCARQGLPSPKTIHRQLRLYAFLRLARHQRTVEQIAYSLGTTTRASMDRGIRLVTGRSARQFASTDPGVFWDNFVLNILLPDAPGWKRFGMPETLVAA